MTATTTEPATIPMTGTLSLWTSDDGQVEVIHHFGGTEPRIEIRKAGAEQPVHAIKTTRFWPAEQREAIDLAQRFANGEPIPALTAAAAPAPLLQAA
jgi:hypothetical protein